MDIALISKIAEPMDIKIKPKVPFLSPTELTAKRHVELEPLRLGLKRTLVTGTEEETRELNEAYDKFRAQLAVPRIERLAGRALATWDVDQQAVQVIRKDGKFEHFGYSCNGKDYLENYEAMFLLELGRLQLEFNAMIVSVEQAYLLLLGEANNPKHNEYLVYSNLSRVGFIVVKHRNDDAEPATSTDCIWALLEHNIHNKPLPDNVLKSPHIEEIKINMNNIKEHIIEHLPPESDETSSPPFTFQLQKRKADNDETKSNKKPRHSCPATNKLRTGSKSLVDFLKDETEYGAFKHIFDSFDVIRLRNNNLLKLPTDSREFKLTFDLHLHNNGFRKRAPILPTFSIIILSAHETFPTHDELVHCHQQQHQPRPILVITVNETKQIQAFLYHFS